MDIKKDKLCVTIKDEEMSVPFEAFGQHFDLSSFHVEAEDQIHECFCLHKGNLSEWQGDEIPVRIHSGCITSEVFGAARCDCGWQLKHALDYISDKKKGLLIYLPGHEGCGNGLHQKVKSFRLMDDLGMTSSEAYGSLGLPSDNRDYSPAIAVLLRFNLLRIQLITNSPAKIDAVKRGGIEVIKRIPTVIPTTDPHIIGYLDSKVKHFGHLING